MKALEGITVVTLEHANSAPFCTRQLATDSLLVELGYAPPDIAAMREAKAI